MDDDLAIKPPTPNLPLLRKVIDWAEAEAAKTEGPCLWDQELFFKDMDCGTAYCIAGYVMSLQPGYHAEPYMWPTLDGRSVDFWHDAQDLLGLTRDETVLFNPENTIADVRRIAEGIAKRAGERL